MKDLLLLISFCLIAITQISSQTTQVQSFTYESTNRDTLVSFPTDDHNQYSKILMYYSMRCKDGLVSTGTERNKGCGEWDYSCNTYVVDSSQMDSLPRVAPSHLISNFNDIVYDYTTQPTHTYYQSTQLETTYTSTTSESSYVTGAGTDNENLSFGSNNISRSQLLYPATALQETNISGLKIDLPQAGEYQQLRIRIKNTSLSDLESGGFDDTNLTQVYFRNTTVTPGTQFLRFYQNFTWDGSSNLLIDLSYVNDNPIANSVTATTQTAISGIHADASMDNSIEIDAVGNVDFQHPLPAINDQITLTAWTYGFSSLPANTYLAEGKDASNNRQINVHLPWSNGSVFWDCGFADGSYDRISKAANTTDYKEQWNHWAFTKNTTTGIMNIYLNGSLWQSGTGMTKPIDIQYYTIGSSTSNTSNYRGKIDDFSIWQSELTQSEIQELMYNSVKASHPKYDQLVAYYNFNNDGATVSDISGNGYDGTTGGVVSYRPYKATELISNITRSTLLPNLTLVNGTYTATTNEQIYMDSLVNAPNQVRSFSVVGTDLTLDNTEFLYQATDQNIYDEAGVLVGAIPVTTEGSITITDLAHYEKSPMRYELMSFVTPYGIGLDFGLEGKTWVFDVTDFGPILKGDKRILMNRGGQWQEDMDIRFDFIAGTPPRNVIETKQLYQVISASNASIRTEENYEPRRVKIPDGSDYTKVRAVITGHGQQGEFEPRNHFLNILGGANDFTWFLDTECAFNPVFPQGGTWIYDRAGWCPGAPSDVNEFNITPFVTAGDTIDLDYGMAAASGTSNYIVNLQMVSYGPSNFTREIEIVDVASPSNSITHTRYNANCTAPKIVIKNNGAEMLETLDIEYTVNGSFKETHQWTGFLPFGSEEEVTLPFMNSNAFIQGGTNSFEVTISNPNGAQDENTDNDTYTTNFESVDNLSKDVIVLIRTNSANFETRYNLLDINNNIILSGNGFSANTTYRDTIFDLHGCYKLAIVDSDQDGIAWWANGDGDGYISIGSVGEPLKRLEPDFGAVFNYEFVADDVSSNQELLDQDQVIIYPNPTSDMVKIELYNLQGNTSLNIYNLLGERVHTASIYINTTQFTKEIDLSSYEAGSYHLEISNAAGKLTKPLIKI